MIYSGSAISVQALDNGIAELKFDLAGESVNKFNAVTVNELAAATQAIKADSSIKGVVVTSGKGVFIVGADITEFGKPPQGPDFNAVLNMIELARRFDLQVKAMKTAEDNGAASAQLLKNA